MAGREVRNVGFRMDRQVHDKLFYIVKYEGRTLNGQIRSLVLDCIRKFERENGPISAEDMQNVLF